jgi:hypothetical protein
MLPVAGARPLETGEQAPDHLSGRWPHVAARLEQVAKTINADVIVSAAMLPRLALPEDVDVLDRGEHMVNGVAKPLQVYSLARASLRRSISREPCRVRRLRALCDSGALIMASSRNLVEGP